MIHDIDDNSGVGGGTENFLRDGDDFPYLIEREFWIPALKSEYTSLGFHDMAVFTEGGANFSLRWLSDGSSPKSEPLPVLPVIILHNVNLTYDNVNTTITETYWDIEAK